MITKVLGSFELSVVYLTTDATPSNCMVYINTLMLQQVLARPHWANRLTPRDHHALTPLIWEHVNPYARYELDMHTRIAALT